MKPDYKTALVTGASRGIGASICRTLVAEGFTVHALARDAATLEGLAAELGPTLRPLVCDVMDSAAILAAVPGLAVDVLVNNAGGVGTVRPLWEQTAEETAQTIALNLTAPVQLMQAVLPGMIARGRGHIVNLCSMAGQGAMANTTVYGAAKAALSLAGRSLRFDLAGKNIRITEVSPGRVETEFYLNDFQGDAETLKDRMYTRQRSLMAEDIAAVVLTALQMPERANITEMTVMPTDQALGGHVYTDRNPA